MKKKDTLVTLFKDSILNEGLTPKVKGGRTEVTTISRDGIKRSINYPQPTYLQTNNN